MSSSYNLCCIINLPKKQPKLIYSIQELNDNVSESLNFTANKDTISINQVVHWADKFKPVMKKEGNTLKIIFYRKNIVSILSSFELSVRITNLQQGKYNVREFYDGRECLYENSNDWGGCDKLKRGRFKIRDVFIKEKEFDVDIISYLK